MRLKKRKMLLGGAALLATVSLAPHVAESGGDRKSTARPASDQGRDALDKQKEITKAMAGVASSQPASSQAVAAAQADLDAENATFDDRMEDLRRQEKDAGKDRKKLDRVRKQTDKETDAHQDRVAALTSKLDRLRGTTSATARDTN